MSIEVFKIGAPEWAQFSELSHLAVFGERRPWQMERIDFALVATDKATETTVGYVTCREFDAFSLYWQYGGATPMMQGHLLAVRGYQATVALCKSAGYRRITTLVEADNVKYLRLAMSVGFRIIGCRLFDGIILVELKLDLQGEKR